MTSFRVVCMILKCKAARVKSFKIFMLVRTFLIPMSQWPPVTPLIYRMLKLVMKCIQFNPFLKERRKFKKGTCNLLVSLHASKCQIKKKKCTKCILCTYVIGCEIKWPRSSPCWVLSTIMRFFNNLYLWC